VPADKTQTRRGSQAKTRVADGLRLRLAEQPG
jgi:hypothetical protein